MAALLLPQILETVIRGEYRFHLFLATLLGIVPGTFVYVSVGAGLGSIFDAGGECSLTGIFTPQVLIALIGLAVLALIPLIYKKLKARRGGTG